jgi:hypothetical protein
MAGIVLANESALGTLVFSWVSPSTGNQARVVWGPGMQPMVCFRAPGRREVTRPIVRPERLGWTDPSQLPGRKQVAAVRALAMTFATAMEEDDDA